MKKTRMPRGWKSDPSLAEQTRLILAEPVERRLEQLEAEANFFLAVEHGPSPTKHRAKETPTASE